MKDHDDAEVQQYFPATVCNGQRLKGHGLKTEINKAALSDKLLHTVACHVWSAGGALYGKRDREFKS